LLVDIDELRMNHDKFSGKLRAQILEENKTMMSISTSVERRS